MPDNKTLIYEALVLRFITIPFVLLTVSFSMLFAGLSNKAVNAASCNPIKRQIDFQEAALRNLRADKWSRWKVRDENLRKQSDALAKKRRAKAEEEQARDELQAGKCYILSNRHRPDCVKNAARVEEAKARRKSAEQEFQRLRRAYVSLDKNTDIYVKALNVRDKLGQLRAEFETCKKGVASSGTAWVPVAGPPANPCPYVPGWNMPVGAECSGGSSGPPPGPGGSTAGAAGSGGQPPPSSSQDCTIGNTLVGEGCVQ